ncbi:uncharacterized protein PAC_17993 [Phialocephala subalpina]|uniref:Amidohydrolase-related domain-containing protein n=1 Tax=Phialocephala subalpina TaxID=576137 RepID=A0A1L7XSS8_9HELO|nr:uncharacterized protein PAC_17993 [Phialocephala subalpina]
MAASTKISGTGRVDTHHHFFPTSVLELASEFTGQQGDQKFQFPSSVAEHITFMDEYGVQTAVVSPSIQKQWHTEWSAELYYKLCVNSFKAQQEMIKENPLRFGGFAMIPLPHIEESLKFVRDTQTEGLKPDGFAVATSHGHKFLGDPSFDPVWTELDALSAAVFVHPGDTNMPEGLNYPPFVIEFPFDTARAILSILTSGALTKFPNIRFIFSHNGGAFPFLADRCRALDQTIMANNDGRNLHDLLEKSNMFFDTALSFPVQWALVKGLGMPATRFVHATDFPYTAGESGAAALGAMSTEISGEFTDKEINEDIAYKNAITNFFPRLKEEWEKAFGREVFGEKAQL